MNPKIERMFFKFIFGLMLFSVMYVVGRCSYDSQQRIDKNIEMMEVK